MEVGEGYQFRTKPQFSKYVQSYFKVTSLVLSPSCLEVLAFIAYKQPVSRIELGVCALIVVEKKILNINKESVNLMDQIISETSPNPEDWLGLFIQRRTQT